MALDTGFQVHGFFSEKNDLSVTEFVVMRGRSLL